MFHVSLRETQSNHRSTDNLTEKQNALSRESYAIDTLNNILIDIRYRKINRPRCAPANHQFYTIYKQLWRRKIFKINNSTICLRFNFFCDR